MNDYYYYSILNKTKFILIIYENFLNILASLHVVGVPILVKYCSFIGD